MMLLCRFHFSGAPKPLYLELPLKVQVIAKRMIYSKTAAANGCILLRPWITTGITAGIFVSIAAWASEQRNGDKTRTGGRLKRTVS
jgi:hypothetical protein